MDDLKSRIEGLDDLKYCDEGLDDFESRVVDSSSPFLPFLKNDLRLISIAKEIIKDPEASPYWPPTTESVNKLVEVIRSYEGQKRAEKVLERAIAKVDSSE